MKPLNNSFSNEIRKHRRERLSEAQEAYRQEVIKRLQEARSQRKQRMQYLKDLANLEFLQNRDYVKLDGEQRFLIHDL